MTPSSWQGCRKCRVWQSEKQKFLRLLPSFLKPLFLPTRPRGGWFPSLSFQHRQIDPRHTRFHRDITKRRTHFPKEIFKHTHTHKTQRERERERWGRNENCVRQRDQLSLREDTDLSGIRVRSRRFSIHKLRAEFRCDVARTISPAGAAIARLLLGNHGAAVARRGASSALSFSHLWTDVN